MRPMLIFAALSCIAAAPADPPKALTITIRTAGDLADACSASTPALLNFCNGFAQGVVQTERQDGKSKICFPSPAPKRTETMKEFALWVKADAARRKEQASAGLIKFMAGRFPCTA
jgi:hypothetical protein